MHSCFVTKPLPHWYNARTSKPQSLDLAANKIQFDCPCIQTADAELLSTLTINTDKVAVGSLERLIFWAVSPVGKTIRLYSGTYSARTFLFHLMDDGSYSYRDVAAGDGVYSNTMIAECSSEGDMYYSAEVEGSSVAPLVAVLHCFVPATDIQVTGSIAVATEIQEQLELLIQHQGNVSQGNTSQALDTIADILRNSTDVDSSTVVTTGQGIIWRTNEGLGFRAYVPLPGQRAAPQIPPSSSAAEVVDANKAKGYAHGEAYLPEWVKGLRSTTAVTVAHTPVSATAAVDTNVTGMLPGVMRCLVYLNTVSTHC